MRMHDLNSPQAPLQQRRPAKNPARCRVHRPVGSRNSCIRRTIAPHRPLRLPKREERTRKTLPKDKLHPQYTIAAASPDAVDPYAQSPAFAK